MPVTFPKPNVFISRCLGFDSCRWNGAVIPDAFVKKLEPFVTVTTACPECEIGLGVPRDPVRVVSCGGALKLMQLGTGRDVTAQMTDFISGYLGGLKDVDGFILKDRSPSCGIKEVRVYAGLQRQAAIKKDAGFFGKAVMSRFPDTAVESEARMTNLLIREHFLTRIFTMARFRRAKGSQRLSELVQFHAEHKFLLMAYSQKHLRLLGAITANRDKKAPAHVYDAYENILAQALRREPSPRGITNVLLHALGYFSDELKPEEKKYFLNTLEEYRREQVPAGVAIGVIRSYVVRFDTGYLKQQVFFEPFPRELLDLSDSARG